MKRYDYDQPTLFDGLEEDDAVAAPAPVTVAELPAPVPAIPEPGQPVDEHAICKQVIKAFNDLCQAVRRSADTVFDHWLEFILNGWQVEGEGLKWWNYTPEETMKYKVMYNVLLESMARILTVRDWYDFLGVIYENGVAGLYRKKGGGQFFTPIHVCDLMSKLAGPSKGKKDESICDPCCGSGRLLLAGHAENPEAVVHATDLDRTCVLMTAVNLLLHGCRGTVVWGNSLVPDDVRETWYINPMLGNPDSPLGVLPHCYKETQDTQSDKPASTQAG